jgi:hypothetical protein
MGELDPVATGPRRFTISWQKWWSHLRYLEIIPDFYRLLKLNYFRNRNHTRIQIQGMHLRTFLCFGRLARLGADGNSDEATKVAETSENNRHVDLQIEAVPLNTRGVLAQIVDILL